MAQRRMFSLKIVASDDFLDMPTSSRELYFQLGMYADDDGFVSPKKIVRMIGASEDDIKLLIAKRFILPFENGVVVIKHWLINNLIRKDFYQPTQYIEQKNQLVITENKGYSENVNNLSPQVRLGKVRIGKIKKIPVASVADLKKTFFENPIMADIQETYPDRNYEFQFKLMVDWWQTNKSKLPQNISAFSNWLRNTQPDPKLQAERRSRIDKEASDKKQAEIDATPQAKPETLKKLREQIDQVTHKKSI